MESVATFISVDTSEFKDSFTCSICLELLCKPMTLICGHNFCDKCISQEENSQCPSCRTVYFKPTDHNKVLESVIHKIFPSEYMKRTAEFDRENSTEESMNKSGQIYAEVYRKMAERARNNYANGPPPAFERVAEALDTIRQHPENILRAVSWYNQRIRYAMLALLFSILFDLDSITLGIIMFIVVIGGLFDYFTPITLSWIQYGEGVFRNINERRGHSPQRNHLEQHGISPRDINMAIDGLLNRMNPAGNAAHFGAPPAHFSAPIPNQPGELIAVARDGTVSMGPMNDNQAALIAAQLSQASGIPIQAMRMNPQSVSGGEPSTPEYITNTPMMASQMMPPYSIMRQRHRRSESMQHPEIVQEQNSPARSDESESSEHDE